MADPDFTKHRLDERGYSVAFAGDLESGDGLSAVSEVVVTERQSTGPGFVDTSTEFHSSTGGLSGSVNGTDVEFTLGAASTGTTHQDGGPYFIRVQVTTSGGETLNAVKKLGVDELADVTAPTT